jgi:hypothetical protein
MDTTRLKQLAGLAKDSTDNPTYSSLMEVVELSDDLSLDELIKRLDACSRALKIVSTLPDPADKKKWMSATFVNLNKVRAALQRQLRAAGFPADDAAVISGLRSGKAAPVASKSSPAPTEQQPAVTQ